MLTTGSRVGLLLAVSIFCVVEITTAQDDGSGDIDYCQGVTCENGGTCVDDLNGLTCNCTTGYTGATCQTISGSWDVCTVYGDAHYITFDWAAFSYQGVCRHLLVDVCANDTNLPRFKIYGRNEFRNGQTTVSWPRYVEIVFNGTTVRLERTGMGNAVAVTVNQVVVTLPHAGPNFDVSNDGGPIVFHGPGDLIVRFDGIYHIHIYLKSAYREALCGMCGNFNLREADDYRTSDGTDVSADVQRGKLIGDSWVDTTDPEYDPAICPGPIPPPPPPPPGACVAICDMVVERYGLCGIAFGHVTVVFLETIRNQCYIDMYYSDCAVAEDFIWWWRSVVSVLIGDPVFDWPPIVPGCPGPKPVCWFSGDPHYRTFDAMMFDYQGVCKYNLASPCQQYPYLPYFQVFARNENRNGETRVSYLRYVEIVHNETTVRITKDESTTTGIAAYALVG